MQRPDLDELGADWWEAYTELRSGSVWFCSEGNCAFPARKNHKCKKHGGVGLYKATTPLHSEAETHQPNKGFLDGVDC